MTSPSASGGGGKKWVPVVLLGVIALAAGWTVYVSRGPAAPHIETPEFLLAEKIRETLRPDPRFINIQCLMPMGGDKTIKLSGEVESPADVESLRDLIKPIPTGEFTIEIRAQPPPARR